MTALRPGSSPQHTLVSPIEIEGVGLFTGVPARVRIVPAEVNTGIVFERADLATPVRIPALIEHLAPAEHRTALSAEGVRIETVEHCLAALMGTGVDNAIVEVHGPELPIGDGCCSLFTEPISSAGLTAQGEARRELVITEMITITDDETGASITAEPGESDSPHYRYALDYGDDSVIAAHNAEVELTPERFVKELAFARTFSTMDEAAHARSLGLFAHLTPKDLLVIGPDGPLDNALRAPDEPARHKVIDMVGDLALTGARLRGRISADRSGHTMNHMLAQELLESL